MNEITIPLCYLQAVRLFAPKKPDVRFYMNSVCLKDGVVVASDGQKIAAIKTHSDRVLPELLIPLDAIDFYVKKAGRSTVKDVTIRWSEDGNGELTNGNAVEPFKAVEGCYPDLMRAVPPIPTEPTGHPQFQWSYLVLYEKAAEILGTTKGEVMKALVVPTGDEGTARVVLPGHPQFIGAVAPLLSKWVKEALAEVMGETLV